MAENLYRRATKEEREAAWAESRMYYEIQEATNRDVARQEGRAAGLAEGEKRGAAQEKREIAQGMLREGMTKELIAKLTGLTLSEVAEL